METRGGRDSSVLNMQLRTNTEPVLKRHQSGTVVQRYLTNRSDAVSIVAFNAPP